MSNQLFENASQAIVKEVRVDEFAIYRWQSADDVAWDLLDSEENFPRAKWLFGIAVQEAGKANFNDYRCGSSLAGQALACYRLVKSKLYPNGNRNAKIARRKRS